MSQQIDRPGIFRGRIVEYGLREFDSSAVAITVRAEIDEEWSDDRWEDWRQYDMEAHGLLFIIKKNGDMNNGQVESLVKSTGWDGSLVSIPNQTWKPEPCQFVINEETYKDQKQYRISFVNPYDRIPGATSNISEDKVKALEARFGGSLRAIAGSVKRNSTAPAPAAKMPSPKKPPAKVASNGDEIPF